MATVSKYRGKWKCQVRKAGYPQRTKSFTLKADAEAWGRSIEVAMETGKFREEPEDDSDIETVEQLLDAYLTKESIKKADGGEHDRARAVPLKEQLGSYSIHQLRSKRLNVFRDEQLVAGVSPQTVIHQLNLLHRAYVVAVEEWEVPLRTTIPKATKPEAPSGRENRIRPAALKKIVLATESPELGLVIRFAVETCMRRSEITRMKWEDVNFKRTSVFIPKTKTDKPRTVPLTPEAVKALQAVEGKREGNVFSMKPGSISQAFKRAVDRVEMDHLVFHDLRHEGISRLFEKGWSQIEVARVSGHKTLSQLDRYTHLDVRHLTKKMWQQSAA